MNIVDDHYLSTTFENKKWDTLKVGGSTLLTRYTRGWEIKYQLRVSPDLILSLRVTHWVSGTKPGLKYPLGDGSQPVKPSGWGAISFKQEYRFSCTGF